MTNELTNDKTVGAAELSPTPAKPSKLEKVAATVKSVIENPLVQLIAGALFKKLTKKR